MKSLDAQYDKKLDELQAAVAARRMTVNGALAKAFILGIAYQTEVDAESAKNAAWGAAEEARIRAGGAP